MSNQSKSISIADSMDITTQAYFNGQSVIEERKDSNQFIEEHGGGLTYVDEAVRTRINTNLTTPSRTSYSHLQDANFNDLGHRQPTASIQRSQIMHALCRFLCLILPLVLLSLTANSASAMLNPTLGRFMQEDPKGYVDGMNDYDYVMDGPSIQTDPSGNITVKTISSAPSEAGSFNVQWKFTLDNNTCCDGYIVQKVVYQVHSTDKRGTETSTDKTYWEAWLVKAGKQDETGSAYYSATDYAKEQTHGGTKGEASQVGEIKFFLLKPTIGASLGDPFSGLSPKGDVIVVPPDPSSGFGGANQEPWSHELPSTKTEPVWWKKPSDNGEADAKREVKTTWDATIIPSTTEPIYIDPPLPAPVAPKHYLGPFTTP